MRFCFHSKKTCHDTIYRKRRYVDRTTLPRSPLFQKKKDHHSKFSLKRKLPHAKSTSSQVHLRCTLNPLTRNNIVDTELGSIKKIKPSENLISQEFCHLTNHKKMGQMSLPSPEYKKDKNNQSGPKSLHF